MEFSSILFIWVFLPIALIGYCLLFTLSKRSTNRTKLLNGFLLAARLVFSFYAGFKELLLLLAMILVNYGAGRWIGQLPDENKRRKTVFIAALAVNLLILGFFKYFNMLITLTEILFTHRGGLTGLAFALAKFDANGSSHALRIAMPLAISFTTFQSVSYLADVYKKRTSAEGDLLRFALYISFFVQIVQGPIMRFQDLGGQIRERSHSPQHFAEGIIRFSFGLGKKVIIANTLALTCDRIWGKGLGELYCAEAWLGLVMFLLQIYYDFSGYTDMAVGIGQMFGFRISENFNYPFTSQSVQEFWRRWHISLSTWFRDYVYIPLGGSRKGEGRTILNYFIVFLLTGVWHGGNLNFIGWGVLVAIQIILEKRFLGAWLKKNPIKPLNCLYAFFSILMGAVLFRSPNLYTAVKFYGALFHPAVVNTETTILSYFNADLFIALFAALFCAGFVQRAAQPFYERIRDKSPVVVLRIVWAFAILIWSVMSIMNGSYNPSIYTNF